MTESSSKRMPVVYLPHGGGPWPFVDVGFGPKEAWAPLAEYLRKLADVPPEKPKALLVISAHWEENVPTLMTGKNPPLDFDYYGFPKESYELTWPAPGAPELASRVKALLREAGLETADDEARGYDHGTFVPLKVAYPDADIPVLQLSLVKGLDPKAHIAIGRALAPLREEGVFIIGSGMSYHNLREIRGSGAAHVAKEFDAWLSETTPLEAKERNARLAEWVKAPSARAAHPREEHLIPLMVVAGAAGDDRGTVPFKSQVLGVAVSAHHFG